VIQAEETGQVPGVTPAVAEFGQASVVTFVVEVGGDPTAVVEVALLICQQMECKLGGTSLEHPQYCPPKVLTCPSFSSPLLLLIELGRYHLGQSRHSQEH
jgi:hypothetical protein